MPDESLQTWEADDCCAMMQVELIINQLPEWFTMHTYYTL